MLEVKGQRWRSQTTIEMAKTYTFTLRQWNFVLYFLVFMLFLYLYQRASVNGVWWCMKEIFPGWDQLENCRKNGADGVFQVHLSPAPVRLLDVARCQRAFSRKYRSAAVQVVMVRKLCPPCTVQQWPQHDWAQPASHQQVWGTVWNSPRVSYITWRHLLNQQTTDKSVAGMLSRLTLLLQLLRLLSIRYDTVCSRALKSWRDGRPNLAHGTEMKKTRKN